MLRILMANASPPKLQALQLADETAAIKSKLLAGDHSGQFKVDVCADVSVDDLREKLRGVQPDVLHFSGHSIRGELLFEGNAWGHRVPKESLADMLKLLKGRLRCVVLNACTSDEQAAEIARTIDCVIGIRSSIDDDAAIAFSRGFYEALAWGDSVGKAFELARNSIHLSGSAQHTHPQLCCRPGVDPHKVHLTFCIPAVCIAADSDRVYLDELLDVQLAPLVNSHALSCWEASRDLTAWDLEAETTKQLESARLVIVLLSADLLASETRMPLVQRALVRHTNKSARVVPIRVRRLDVSTTVFRALPILPPVSKSLSEYRVRDEGWLEVMKPLRKIIELLEDSEKAAVQEKPPPLPPPPLVAVPKTPRTPTERSVRVLLPKMFPAESAFAAFCLDHFRETHQLFSSGMDRTQRTTLLLSNNELQDIVAALMQEPTFSKYKDLLQYE